MDVEIWSDIVCPWCYIGKRNLERALQLFEHRAEVSVRWRSFQLDPNAPPVRDGSYARRLGTKYGVGPTDAQAMIDRMTAAGARAGLDFRFDLARPGNTFDAHRLLHLGASHGLQDQLKERFLAATFTEGAPIGDHEVLLRLSVEVGLDRVEVGHVLETGAFADAVRVDKDQASHLGISGVPFFVVDRRFALSGAQAPDVIADILQRAWTKTELVGAAPSDGPDGQGGACPV